MIESIRIRNFQSHRDTHLNFHPGVNILVGSSDSGKSAVIRALRWVVYGKPRGDGFRSWWGGDTSVTLSEEGGAITRIKTNSDQSYTLFAEGMNEPLVFRAFGNDIPEEVVGALSMEDLNLQQQSDSPYLINNSAGEVAIHFNRMANLQKIDTGTRAVQSLIRGLEQTIKNKTEQLGETRAKYAALAWIDAAEGELSNLAKKVAKRDDTEHRANSLKKYVSTLGDLSQRIEKGSRILQSESLINNIAELDATAEQKRQTIQPLAKLIRKIENNQTIISGLQKIAGAEKGIEEALGFCESLITRKEHHSSLNSLLRRLRNTTVDIDQLTQTITREQAEYDENMPDICPLCNTNLA